MQTANDILSNLEEQSLLPPNKRARDGFNLLAWREQSRINAYRKFWQTYTACLFLASIILLITHFILDYQVKLWGGLNQILKNELHQLSIQMKPYVDTEIKIKLLKNNLVTLQTNELQAAYLLKTLDSLPKIKPIEIRLQNLNYANNKMLITGWTEQITTIAFLIKKMQQALPGARISLQAVNLNADKLNQSENFKIEINYKNANHENPIIY